MKHRFLALLLLLSLISNCSESECKLSTSQRRKIFKQNVDIEIQNCIKTKQDMELLLRHENDFIRRLDILKDLNIALGTSFIYKAASEKLKIKHVKVNTLKNRLESDIASFIARMEKKYADCKSAYLQNTIPN